MEYILLLEHEESPYVVPKEDFDKYFTEPNAYNVVTLKPGID